MIGVEVIVPHVHGMTDAALLKTPVSTTLRKFALYGLGEMKQNTLVDTGRLMNSEVTVESSGKYWPRKIEIGTLVPYGPIVERSNYASKGRRGPKQAERAFDTMTANVDRFLKVLQEGVEAKWRQISAK